MTDPIDFGILLGLAYQTFVDELRSHLEGQGFSDIGTSYGYVFRALNLEALHLRQLAERLGMSDQGAAKIVNEMEERGYLQKHADAGDGRIKKLMLSKRGLAALQAARQFHQTFEETLAGTLPARKIITTRRVLEAMVAKTGGDVEHARLRAI